MSETNSHTLARLAEARRAREDRAARRAAQRLLRALARASAAWREVEAARAALDRAARRCNDD